MDHAVYIIGDVHGWPLWVNSICFLCGGVTFLIMGYLLVEGYRHTRNLKRYLLRLLGFALLAQLPYQMILMPQLNVLFTLFLGLLAFALIDRVPNLLGKILLGIGVIILANRLSCDWGYIGVVMLLAYRYVPGKWGKLLVGYGVALLDFGSFYLPFILEYGIIWCLPEVLFTAAGGLMAVLLLSQYSGERGPKTGYLFYIFYPAHIILLGLINQLVSMI